MRPERHPVLVDLAQLAQAENLESPGVRQNCPIPRHKPMQPTHFAYGLNTGTQVEMIGVTEDDLRA